MTLAELLQALGKIEDRGAEYVAYLKELIANKDATIATAESLANSSEVARKSIATSLGCSPDEIEATLKDLKKAKKEVETLTANIEAQKAKIAEGESRFSKLERETSLREFAATVGADYEVIKDLLPGELEFKEGEIIVEGKSKPFAEFVDEDPKLSKYRNSIFTIAANPPTGTKLPQGKSSDQTKDPISSVKETEIARQKAKAAKLAQKFSTVK